MSDVLSGLVAGIVQGVVGHPLDTVKVLIQNRQRWWGVLSPTCYYRGCLYPMLSSVTSNGIVFPVFERSKEALYSSAWISGC